MTTPITEYKYSHNQICTPKSIVKDGELYNYYEDGQVCQVRVIEQEPKDDWIGFKLEVTKDPTSAYGGVGKKFECGAATGHYAYNGMWRLYPNGEYIS